MFCENAGNCSPGRATLLRVRKHPVVKCVAYLLSERHDVLNLKFCPVGHRK